MKFNEAYAEMAKGKKITRPAFKGFWFIDPVKGKLTIHLSSGKEITYEKPIQIQKEKDI